MILKMDSPKGEARRQKELFNKVRILKITSPKRSPHRQKELFKQVRILNINSPEGETPQADRAYTCISVE